jgi:thiol-disulfide isomerase/thioredoxin
MLPNLQLPSNPFRFEPWWSPWMRGCCRLALFGALVLGACKGGAPSSQKAASPGAAEEPLASMPEKPRLIPGATPVAPFVAEQLAKASETTTIVYVGASWCEPCRRFHQALQNGEYDSAFQNVRFIEYDHDVADKALVADGYTSKLLPFFAIPKPDGRCSTRSIEGSVKGPSAVQNLRGRLRELLVDG